MNDPRLDGGKNVARGIAALLVCVAHAYGFFLYPHFGSDNLASDFFGLAAHQSVMVFFAISGFLITKSILANINRNDTFSLRDYLFTRIARIYPPLVFSIALTCLLYALIQWLVLAGSSTDLPYSVGAFPQAREFFSVTPQDVWYALKMNNGMLLANGPLWSLCIEWWIYIVIGLAVYIFSVRGLLLKLLWSGLLGLALSKLYSVNSNALFYFGIWALGGVMSIANHRAGWFATRQPVVICVFLMAICLLAWLKPGLILAGGRHFGLSENAVQFVICAFWCLFILPEQYSNKTLVSRALFYLGECSYSLYILHFPLMLFMLSVLQSTFGTSLQASLSALPVTIVLSVAVAYLSAVWFEDKNRFLRLIQKAEAYVFPRLGQFMSHFGIFMKIRSLFKKLGLISARSSRRKKKEKQSTPALNNLDELLARYLNYPSGFFIECGANNGYAQSNTYYLEKQLGWRGLLVEGIPDLYEKCKIERPSSIVRNVALVSREFTGKTVTMHYCNLMSVVEGSMKSPEMQEEHLNAGFDVQKIENRYSIDVPAYTLSSLLDEIEDLGKIDFLVVRVEGDHPVQQGRLC